jgi:hypothetical protein
MNDSHIPSSIWVFLFGCPHFIHKEFGFPQWIGNNILGFPTKWSFEVNDENFNEEMEQKVMTYGATL